MSDVENLGLLYEKLNFRGIKTNLQNVRAVELERMMYILQGFPVKYNNILRKDPEVLKLYNQLNNDVVSAFEKSDYSGISDLEMRFKSLLKRVGDTEL